MGQIAYSAAVLANTPRVFYKMDDASGNPVDSSGNGFNCVSCSSATYRVAGPGPNSYGIQFASGGQFLYDHVVSIVQDNFTLDGWVQGITFNTNQIPWYCGSAVDGWGILSAADGKFAFLAQSVAIGATSTGALSTSQYTYFAIVRRSGTWEYYIDGSVDTSNAGTNNPNVPTSATFGGSASLAYKASNMTIYNSALSAATIAANYAAMIATDATVYPQTISYLN